MNFKHVTLPVVASALAVSLAVTGPAIAQKTTSTPPVSATTDKGVVPEGAVARANALIGISVRNSAGDKVGTIDDMLLGSDWNVNYAVLSVGGFLGIGDRLIAVPMGDLQPAADHMVLPSATKETLSKMSKFDRSAVHYPGYVKDMPRATPPASPPPGGTQRPTN